MLSTIVDYNHRHTIIYISLSVTDKGPPMVYPSICLQNLLLKVKVTSVRSFINNLLKISLEHICGSTF